MRSWSEQAYPELSGMEGEVGLLPVGATEQHGPHLPTGTDTIIASAICSAVSERTGAPVLPALAVTCSYGHATVLPGTLSLSPELLAANVRHIAEWAAASSGLVRLLLVNAHVGNAAALAVAVDHLRLFRPDLQVGVVDWWSADPTVAKEMLVDGSDVHAHRAETAVMLAIAPELVHLDRIAEADDADRTEGLVFRYTAPALSSNGVTGRPSLARAELGRQLFERAVSALCETVGKARLEHPPLGRAPFPFLSTGGTPWTP